MSFKNATVVGKSVNPAEYHTHTAKRGDVKYVMSSSNLREFGMGPNKWIHVTEEDEKEQTESMKKGSLFDCLLLTPEQFESRYVLQPETYTNDKKEVKPWTNLSNSCKAWVAEQEEAGREVIKQHELNNARRALSRFKEDETITKFLDASDRQVWVKGEWHDDATGLIIPVQCLLDLVPRLDTEFASSLGDLKTTRCAAVLPWQRDCYSMGYHIQAAFYQDIYVAATGEDRNSWCFLLSENSAPYEPGKRILSQDFYVLGKSQYTRMLENYCLCLKHNFWPGYDDTDEAVQTWSIVNPEPWMSTKEQFAPRFVFGGEEIIAETPPEDQDLIP